MSRDVQVRVGSLPESGPDPALITGWGLPTWRYEAANEPNGTVDPAKWNVRDQSTFGNLPDAGVLSSSMIDVLDGKLRIRAQWRASASTTSTGATGNPTVRWMNEGYMDHRVSGGTPLIYEQQFGIWEVRMACAMKVGESLGTGGGMWLRNASSGEVDFTEHWGSGPAAATSLPTGPNPRPAQPKPNAGSPTLTFHGDTMGGGTKKSYTLPNVFDQMRTWRLMWTPDVIQITLDGTVVVNIPQTDSATAYLWTDPGFAQPWHIRFNMHIGVTPLYWGLPDPDHHEWTLDPVQLVEYVRMYNWDNRP